MPCMSRTKSDFFPAILKMGSRYQVDLRENNFRKIAILLWKASSCLILNLMITQMFPGVLELKITANSTVLSIFNGQKASRDFFRFIHHLQLASEIPQRDVLQLSVLIFRRAASACQTLNLLLTFQSSITSCNDFWPQQKIGRDGGLGLGCQPLSPRKLQAYFIQPHHCCHNSLVLTLISLCVYAELNTSLQLTLLQ